MKEVEQLSCFAPTSTRLDTDLKNALALGEALRVSFNCISHPQECKMKEDI